VAFGKKWDPKGEYIKHFIPALQKMPAEFIYEPWTAPLSIQRKAGCIIGEDYPQRICIHEDIMKVNLEKMKAAYSNKSEDTKKKSSSSRSSSSPPSAKRRKK
jgi:cryptochrome